MKFIDIDAPPGAAIDSRRHRHPAQKPRGNGGFGVMA